ncbi:hypothetical protein B0A48_08551 [Cryoendolithus antarcticus]|uniref:Uncharacterized protein n=1 Tax=Cryoendolithus antarcticus TaxID=1507870 RepID=A0A1V8T5T2_9PEZI|nr:hypothetical protein B0A48_08551 [Cryoendolithus antarcticus]
MATHTRQITLDSTSQYELPDAKTLEQASSLEVLDEKGSKVVFKDLYSPHERTTPHTVLTDWQMCEDYVRALVADLPPSLLSQASPRTTLLIIGCGEPPAIAGYKQRTGCPFEIYCDPSRALYSKLGMIQDLGMGDTTPQYAKSSIVGGTVKSMGNMLKAGLGMRHGGDYSQDGGEWVFEKGGELKWCRRMRNTRDHAEVAELKTVLGIDNGGSQ